MYEILNIINIINIINSINTNHVELRSKKSKNMIPSTPPQSKPQTLFIENIRWLQNEKQFH